MARYSVPNRLRESGSRVLSARVERDESDRRPRIADQLLVLVPVIVEEDEPPVVGTDIDRPVRGPSSTGNSHPDIAGQSECACARSDGRKELST